MLLHRTRKTILNSNSKILALTFIQNGYIN